MRWRRPGEGAKIRVGMPFPSGRHSAKPLQEATMRTLRYIPVPAMALAFATLLALVPAQAQKITVGKITGGSGFHTPSYIAMEKGFYKTEGLDASFVKLTGRALGTGGLL